jgi:hypothetical protein
VRTPRVAEDQDDRNDDEDLATDADRWVLARRIEQPAGLCRRRDRKRYAKVATANVTRRALIDNSRMQSWHRLPVLDQPSSGSCSRCDLRKGDTVEAIRCSDEIRVVSAAAYGNCGSSWIYDQKLGSGWITEYYGVSSNGVYGNIASGGAIINWYNFTYTQYHNSYGPLAIYPGPYWDDVHNVYSHHRTIGSWLDAADVMQNGVVCTNYYNQPFDFVYGV